MAGATMVHIRVASTTPNEYIVAIAMFVFTMVESTMWLWLAALKPPWLILCAMLREPLVWHRSWLNQLGFRN
jgi:hypothetical protein